MELTLTGEMLGAQAAMDLGLVSQVVPQEDLLEAAKTLLRKVTRNGPLAVKMALESVYRAQDTSLAEGMATESALFGLLFSTEDLKEGMTAFLEKRKPEFKGR